MRDVKDIQWLKFAQILAARYDYLLNGELAVQMAEDAKEFVKAETGAGARQA